MNKRDRELTAWIDGEMDMPPHAGAPEGRNALAAARRVGDVLRGSAPQATDPGDRFNAQILAAIRVESLGAASARRRDPVLRLAWSGAGLLAASALWLFAFVPRDPSALAAREYYASISRTKVVDAHLSAVPIAGHTDRDLTVVWIDGLEYQPDERTR